MSAPRECRVPRIVARIRGCVVSAGPERSTENESGGRGNLLDGDCWTTIACWSCVRWNAGGALAESHPEEERWRLRWSKLSHNFNKSYLHSKLKLLRESRLALEWSAEQMTEISTEVIDREFLPIRTNQERGAQGLEFILQQMHNVLTDITIGEAKDIVANSQKKPLESWRRLQKRPDSTAGGRERNLLCTIVSPERGSLLELQAEMEHWESAVSQYEEKLKNKMNDEIMLAGLEAVVPKESTPTAFELLKMRVAKSWRVEIVTGEVVCNARTGVRRQHGWTSTNWADRGCSGTTDPGAER